MPCNSTRWCTGKIFKHVLLLALTFGVAAVIIERKNFSFYVTDIKRVIPRNATRSSMSSSYEDYNDKVGTTPIPSWILDYVDWHNQATQSSHDGDNTFGYKYLIYKCEHDCRGLGDRLNGMIELFYVALVTNRIFLISYNYKKQVTLMDTFDEHLIRWNTKFKHVRVGGLLSSFLCWNNKFMTSLDKLVPELLEPSLLPRNTKVLTVSCNQWDPANLWNSKSMQNYLAIHGPRELQQPPPEHLYQWAFDVLFSKNTDLQQNIDLVK